MIVKLQLSVSCPGANVGWRKIKLLRASQLMLVQRERPAVCNPNECSIQILRKKTFIPDLHLSKVRLNPRSVPQILRRCFEDFSKAWVLLKFNSIEYKTSAHFTFCHCQTWQNICIITGTWLQNANVVSHWVTKSHHKISVPFPFGD